MLHSSFEFSLTESNEESIILNAVDFAVRGIDTLFAYVFVLVVFSVVDSIVDSVVDSVATDLYSSALLNIGFSTTCVPDSAIAIIAGTTTFADSLLFTLLIGIILSKNKWLV